MDGKRYLTMVEIMAAYDKEDGLIVLMNIIHIPSKNADNVSDEGYLDDDIIDLNIDPSMENAGEVEIEYEYDCETIDELVKMPVEIPRQNPMIQSQQRIHIKSWQSLVLCLGKRQSDSSTSDTGAMSYCKDLC